MAFCFFAKNTMRLLYKNAERSSVNAAAVAFMSVNEGAKRRAMVPIGMLWLLGSPRRKKRRGRQ